MLVFLMVFIPMLICIALYWCYRKFKSSVVDNISIIGRAETAVKTRLEGSSYKLKYPAYIKFSPRKETSVAIDGNTYTVKGWVKFKNKDDDLEQHSYCVDVIAIEWSKGRYRYETKYLTLEYMGNVYV